MQSRSLRAITKSLPTSLGRNTSVSTRPTCSLRGSWGPSLLPTATLGAAVPVPAHAQTSLDVGGHGLSQTADPVTRDPVAGRVERLIECAASPSHRIWLLTLYATKMQREELVHLKIGDIDSARMLIHVRQGKGRKDRESCSARGYSMNFVITGAGPTPGPELTCFQERLLRVRASRGTSGAKVGHKS